MRLISFVLGLSAAAVVADGAPESLTPIAPVAPGTDLRVAAMEVRVVLDHRDWTYRPSEVPKFRIRVTADEQPIDDATVSFAIAPDMLPGSKRLELTLEMAHSYNEGQGEAIAAWIRQSLGL